ncbi:MAG: transketolase family protein [Rectinemataceae bacterium]
MSARDMRDAYCEALVELAEADDRIVLLEADLMGANGTTAFKERFPKRFFNAGVAEANMVSMAAGMAVSGKIPFAASFACFAARRAYDQFFISVNYARVKMNLTGTDPGISAVFNGGTHMSFEDIGLMRSIPGLVIYEPADDISLKALVKEAAYHPGPTYLRLHRKGASSLYEQGEEFRLGKAKVLREGADIAIFATGYLLVPEALKAAELLKREGIDAAVIDLHTIKPLDEELVLSYARKTGAVMVCENHQVATGVGSAVALFLSETHPTRMQCIGIRDEFGQVGDLAFLKQRFGLNADRIFHKARELLGRKEE